MAVADAAPRSAFPQAHLSDDDENDDAEGWAAFAQELSTCDDDLSDESVIQSGVGATGKAVCTRLNTSARPRVVFNKALVFSTD